MPSKKCFFKWRSSNITIPKRNVAKRFAYNSCFDSEVIFFRNMDWVWPSTCINSKHFEILPQIIFVDFFKPIEGKHSLLCTIVIGIDLVFAVNRSRTYFHQWMVNRNTVTFAIWIFFIVLDQMVVSISFKLCPTPIYDVREVIYCVIFCSCPGIISLSIRMICYFYVMDRIVSKSNPPHCFSLERFFLLQSFNDVGGHRHLSCENRFLSSRCFRHSFFYVINLNSCRGIPQLQYKTFCFHDRKFGISS